MSVMLFEDPAGYARIINSYEYWRCKNDPGCCFERLDTQELLALAWGLYEANLQSHNDRYPNHIEEPICGPEEFMQEVSQHRDRYSDTYAFIKAVHCLDYQIEFEPKDAKTIPARRAVEFLAKLRRSLEAMLICESEQYKAAEWGI
jgi:hypothetical protein